MAGVATPSPTTTAAAAAGGPTTTATAGQLTSASAAAAPVRFAAGCKPGEVALMRFAVAPTKGGRGIGVRVDVVGLGGHVQ